MMLKRLRRRDAVMSIAALCLALSVRGIAAQESESPAEPSEPASAAAQEIVRAENVPAADPGDRIDQLAPQNPAEIKRLRQAAELLRAEQWADAAEILQSLCDQPEDSVVRLHDGRWISVRRHAQHMLGRLPETALNEYRVKYQPVARELLTVAMALDDPRRIAGVATRFLHTPAGTLAAERLAAWHFDHGRFQPAARWYQRLLTTAAPEADSARWSQRTALARGFAGDVDADPPVDVFDDWRMMYGSPSRTGTSRGGVPLLLPLWRSPLSSNAQAIGTVEELVSDLRDGGWATVPANVPLAVNGRLIFATLGGVRVVDGSSGHTLWDTRAEHSVEQQLAGKPGTRGRTNSPAFTYTGRNPERHRVTQLLFGDGVNSAISSDGRRLYVIEDHAVLLSSTPGRRLGGNVNSGKDDQAANRLAAYDLETGRVVWEVGGSPTHDAYHPWLAGHSFCGAPLPIGNDLFVVAERDNEIRLFALHAHSGLPKWSVPVAAADTPLAEDTVRRLWAAQPSLAGGMLICPTTTGWLTAVDRVSGEIVWIHRYAPPDERDWRAARNSRTPLLADAGELNARWSPSAPVIAGSRVIYTPPEEPVIDCVDLANGELLWRRPKEQSLYLAGVFGETVLVVGSDAVEAVALSTGDELWSLPLPDDAGQPSGRGVVVADQFYVPLSSGQLWMIELKTGDVTERQSLPADAPPLGNLVLHRGRLYSLGSQGLSAFQLRGTVEAEIAQLTAGNADDPRALLRQAEIAVLKSEYGAANGFLARIDAAVFSGDEQLQRRRHSVELDTLMGLVRSKNSADASAALDQLRKLAESEAEQLFVRRMEAEQLAAREEWNAAFDAFAALMPSGEAPPLVDADDGRRAVRLDRWVAGRLIDVWGEMNDAARTAVDRRLKSLAAEVIRQDRSAQMRFVTAYGFHADAVEVQQHLARQLMADGDLAGAELLLLRLAEHDEQHVAEAALRTLAVMLQQAGLPADAESVRAVREERFGEPPSTPAELDNDDENDDGPAIARLPRGIPAGAELTRLGSDYSRNTVRILETNVLASPYLRAARFELDAARQRLAMYQAPGDELAWMQPLFSRPNPSQPDEVALSAAGRHMFLLHRDVLHCLAPWERRVRWTHELDLRGGGAGNYRLPERRLLQPFKGAAEFVESNALPSQAGQGGMLAVANANYVAVYGRRKLSVLEASTGELMWMVDSLPADSRVYGTDDVLFIVPPDRSRAEALRAVDGTPVSVAEVAKLVERVIHISGRHMISMETLPGIFRHFANTVVRSRNPVTGEKLWEQAVRPGADFARLGADRLAIQHRDGRLEILHLDTGRLRPLGSLNEDERRAAETFALADDERVYVIANRTQGGVRNDDLQWVHMNGSVTAFNRQTGGRRWRQEILDRRMLVDAWNLTPLALCLRDRTVDRDRLSYRVADFTVLDKRTGRVLLDTPVTADSGFRWFDVNDADGYVELRSYTQRLRLTTRE